MTGKSITVRHLAGTVDIDDFMPGAKKLLKELRPEWKQEEIDIRLLAGGIVNLMLRGRLVTDKENKDAIVIRVFKEGLHGTVHREREVFAMAVFSEVGFAPSVYGVFDNGVVMKFLTGRNMKWAELWQDDFIRKVSAQLAKLHSVDVSKYSVTDDKGRAFHFDGQKTLLSKLREDVQTIPRALRDPVKNERFQKELPSREELLRNLDEMEQWMSKQNLPLVLSHNDLYINNVNYDDQTGDAYFLDFEMCLLNYPPFDIAHIFLDVAILLPLFASGQEGESPVRPGDPDGDEAVYRKWAYHYLKAKGLPSTEEDVAKLAYQTEQFKAFSSLFEYIFLMAVFDSGSYSIETALSHYSCYTSRKHLLV